MIFICCFKLISMIVMWRFMFVLWLIMMFLWIAVDLWWCSYDCLGFFDCVWCSYEFMLMFLWFPTISSCCHDCLMICVWCLMIFLLLLWLSYDCLWFPYDVLTIFLWCSYEFLMVFLRFSMFVVWFLDMFSWLPMICVSPCPMIFVCFPMNY